MPAGVPSSPQHRDVHAGPGVADRAEDRVVGAEVVGSAQARDRHRRLALPVELREDRAERGHRLLQAVDVHRAAAVDHRAQISRARAVRSAPGAATMVGARNALQPGWCSQRSRNSVGLERRRTPGSPAARRAARTAGCRGQSRATSARRGPGCSPRPAHRNRRGARRVIAIRLRCDSIAPLDRPVVPLV